MNTDSRSMIQQQTVYSVLFSISLVHLLNDSIQSVIPAIFPILQSNLQLNFQQIGWIGFTLNCTASILQPLIGFYTDAKPKPFLLPIGVTFSLFGILILAFATSFWHVIISVTFIGVGSSILHPEASRVSYLAAGANRRGLAQSIFQTGGNIGQALGPIFTALIFIPLGQFGIIYFAIAAVVGIIVQAKVARWYRGVLQVQEKVQFKNVTTAIRSHLSKWMVFFAMCILVIMLFSKFVYIAGMTGFYAFFLIEDHHTSMKFAQWFIFALLGAGALGTFLGGPMGDRLGRRNMIWFSILGAAPFSLLLPYANLFWSVVLCLLTGFILFSGFAGLIVYAQELMPGKVGTVSGIFFGIAFGLGGIGSAALGYLADHTSIAFVIQVCSYLPLLGLFAMFLPSDSKLRMPLIAVD